MAEMFGWGLVLPGECRFLGGQAKGPAIHSTYACAGGEVVLELTHSSQAAPESALTEHFAIGVERGEASFALVNAVAALVRTREADFEWRWRAGHHPDDEDDGRVEDDEAPSD